MKLKVTRTPDAIFDVIDGGFRTKPALDLKELGYLSVAHRGWKLKYAPSGASTLSFSNRRAFVTSTRGSFWGRMMLRIQTRNAAFSSVQYRRIVFSACYVPLARGSRDVARYDIGGSARGRARNLG